MKSKLSFKDFVIRVLSGQYKEDDEGFMSISIFDNDIIEEDRYKFYRFLGSLTSKYIEIRSIYNDVIYNLYINYDMVRIVLNCKFNTLENIIEFFENLGFTTYGDEHCKFFVNDEKHIEVIVNDLNGYIDIKYL